MTMSDPLGDMLTRIRNGQRASKRTVRCPASKLRASVLEVLARARAIFAASGRFDDVPARPVLEIELKYHDGAPAIQEIGARVATGAARLFVDLGLAAGL